jgi:hypothetical protein
MDATNLADLYGLPLLDWSQMQARLDEDVTQVPDSGGPNRHKGTATKITDPGTVAAMAARWAGEGWPTIAPGGATAWRF